MVGIVLAHLSNAIRQATAHAIAEGIKLHTTQANQVITEVVIDYRDKVGLFCTLLFCLPR